jgi:Spy/CpxP family protein refolding chaperone
MNTIIRKSVLAVTGLAFAGGIAAGPATSALAAPAAPQAKPAAVASSVVSVDRPAPEKLSPHGVQGAQSRIDLSDEQKANVKAIVDATKKAGMDERAAVISVATSMQESKLQNLGHLGDANDHDSLGLFQQRPTSGWGSPEQITDPQYSTTAFLKGLKAVDGWHDMPLTEAAQKVQVSAYPDAYAQWEGQAADLVGNLWNS